MSLAKLRVAQERTGSLLSVGLEPCPEYQPEGFAPDIEGYERFLRVIIAATAGKVSAYKFNLAFFEALGAPGMELLYKIRESIPDEALLIADAKRGDIGSTAKQYARALYDELGADATTLNPLMGFDSAEPFLERIDKLNFFLVLTSNPGARDFLLVDNLYLNIAAKVAQWNVAGNCGFVTGATRPEQLGELRRIAPNVPFLVPGIGAQGGDLDATIREGQFAGDAFSGIVLHVTRGILPAKDEHGDAGEIIARKTAEWNKRIAKGRAYAR
ncbi:orotidine-5'-phosphate decarboxylase [soil metagenome]